MSRSQVFNAAENFKAVITTPAWREKPSWMVVAGRIELSTPTSNGFMPRANSHTIEVAAASHSLTIPK